MKIKANIVNSLYLLTIIKPKHGKVNILNTNFMPIFSEMILCIVREQIIKKQETVQLLA